jgi:tetratricopeptide (TPR) repeat protein
MGTRPPTHVADLARRAHTALAQDQLALAEELLLRLIAVAPDEPIYASQLATVYQRRGQHGLAIAFALRAAALDPDDPQYARLLGSMLEAGGEPELAREAYLAAVEAGANPRLPDAWLALARLERAQGRLETAERYARRAVELAPRAPEMYAELARVLLQAGDARPALAALDSGLRLAPDDPDLRALRDAALAAAPTTERRDNAEGPPHTDPP